MYITSLKNATRLLLTCLLASGISLQQLKAEDNYVDASLEIFETIDKWAEAWTNLDAVAFVSHYSKNYHPDNNSSHQSWVSGLKHRMDNQQWVKLDISGIVVSKSNDESYTANFRQRYKSNSFRDSVRKELIFVKEDSQWRIRAEHVLESN